MDLFMDLGGDGGQEAHVMYTVVPASQLSMNWEKVKQQQIELAMETVSVPWNLFFFCLFSWQCVSCQ